MLAYRIGQEMSSRKDAKDAKFGGPRKINFSLRSWRLGRENFLKWFYRTFKTEESEMLRKTALRRNVSDIACVWYRER